MSRISKEESLYTCSGVGLAPDSMAESAPTRSMKRGMLMDFESVLVVIERVEMNG